MFIISASRPLFDYLALIVFSPLTAILYLCLWSQIERCCITLITQINYYRYVSFHSNSFPLWAASLLPFSSHLFSCLSSPFSSSLSSQHSSSSWPVRTSGRGTYSLLARLVVVVVRLLILWDWGNKILCKIKSWLDEHQPGHRVEGGADIHCCLLLAHLTANEQISLCWTQPVFSYQGIVQTTEAYSREISHLWVVGLCWRIRRPGWSIHCRWAPKCWRCGNELRKSAMWAKLCF